MARNEKSRNKNNSYRPNLWGFLQNVLIAAVNKGQLPGMFIGLYILIFLLRIPQNELVNLLEKVFDISKINSILGWILAGSTTFGGFLINRYQRRIHTKEIRRISKEKKELQQKLLKGQLPSSNKPK